MNKFLITGISGFVSFHFLNYLEEQNEKCEVLGVDLFIPEIVKNYTFVNFKLKLVQINLLDYPALNSEIINFSPTHILHLAAFSSVAKSWELPIESFINNTNIFLNIVEIIRNNNIKCRLLSVGSSEEYGNVLSKNVPIKETTPLNPVSPYAVARVSQELLSQCYVKSYGLDIVLTRSFNHIGPGQKDIFVIPSIIKQIFTEMFNNKSNEIKILTGDISIIRDFLDVRDVVKAYYLLLEKGIPGELYNVCSGTGHSIQKMINILSNILNVKISTETDKNKIRPGDNRVIIGDNTKLTKLTNWTPQISIDESFRDIITFWKNELNIK